MNSHTLLEGLTFLVVEDDTSSLELFKQILELHNAKVLTALNARDAMITLAKDRPDFLLADMLLPGESGYDMCKRIRSNDEFSQMPIVAVSRFKDVKERVHALRMGADSFISKPVYASELVAVIEALLRFKDHIIKSTAPARSLMEDSVSDEETELTAEELDELEKSGDAADEPAAHTAAPSVTQRELHQLLNSLGKRFGTIFQRGIAYYEKRQFVKALTVWEQIKLRGKLDDRDFNAALEAVDALYTAEVMKVLGAWENLPIIAHKRLNSQVIDSLKSEERQVLHLLQGDANVRDVCQGCSLEKRRTLAILVKFARNGLVKMRDPLSHDDVFVLK